MNDEIATRIAAALERIATALEPKQIIQVEEKKPEPTEKEKEPAVRYRAWEFFDRLWGRYVTTLNGAAVKEWNYNRKRAAQARWNEKPDEQVWERVMAIACASPFCRGEIASRDGHKPFQANIDWFLRPDTRIKLQEGRYSQQKANGAVKLKVAGLKMSWEES